MSKKVGKLAQRYAKALMRAVNGELGRDGSPSPAQKEAVALQQFAGLWENVAEFPAAVLNPMFEKGQREAALVRIAQEAGLSDILQRFLKVTFERERIAALPEIATKFSELADEQAGAVQVAVTVAREVEQSERSSIEQQLSQRIEGSLEFDWKVDPELIGGLIVRYSGKVLDGSLSGRLGRIERKLAR